MANQADNQQLRSNLGSVNMSIAGIIETLLEMGILTHDFEGTADAKAALVDRINKVVEQMDQLNTGVNGATNGAHADEQGQPNLGSTMIPLDVIEYIENGRNPDVYTREFVEVLAKQNQYTKGQMSALAKFQSLLATHLTEAYPDTQTAVDKVLQSTR